MKYIHLKVHSMYSLGESSLAIKDLAKFALLNNLPALALTDTNNMFGAREFSTVMAENGIKPIIGIQIDVCWLNQKEVNPLKGFVTLLAKNQAGYLNLLALHSKLYINNNANKETHVNFSDLIHHSENIILLTGGNEGFLAKVLLQANTEGQTEVIKNLKKAFKNDLYLEINRYTNSKNINLEDNFLKLAKEYNLPIVATNNVFFKEKKDAEVNDIVICIGSGTTINDDGRRRLSLDQYLKSEAEMVELFKDLPEALENTIKIAQKCNFLVERVDPKLPTFKEGADEKALLKKTATESLAEKLEKEILPVNAYLSITEKNSLINKYQSRLNYEIDIINNMGFSGYFLIVADFINWAKNNNIPVGPGRGSGAGSLVAYVLNITSIDPLIFGLIFERFLNPERVSMPDFDIDFCQRRRDEVINYVANKYGVDRVAKIITFGSLQTRAALRDIGRSLGLPYGDVDKICKRIPHSAPSDPITIEKALNNDPVLAEDVANNYLLNKLFSIAKRLEGSYRNISTHAAGIVIGYLPLSKIVPLYKDESSDDALAVAGFSMKYIEDVGLVKFDFLGLKTLTVINETLKQIKEVEGVTVDINAIKLRDDKKIQELMVSGKTLGIFQLESTGMRDMLKQIAPDKIEDFTAIISLYRPGPMENIPSYINRKHGKEKIEYLHPLMREILEETFGIMIYQEQVMEIAQKLANYTLGAADLLRRAMGKKKPEEMAEQKNIFIKGAAENKIDEPLAVRIFEQIAKFAGYGFNKSHAAAYALISWQTAYLKAYYPAEFIAESMTYDMQDTDKLLVFVEDAKNFNITILPPSVNHSFTNFIAEKNHQQQLFIRYSLLAIKGVSKTLVVFLNQEIKKNGKFISIEDFLTRVPNNYLNKKQLEALIKAGAFDDLEANRNKLLKEVENLLTFNQQINNEKNSQQIALFDMIAGSEASTHLLKLQLKEAPHFNLQEKLIHEASVIGFFISSHPLAEYENLLPALKITKYREVIENQQERAYLAAIIIKIKISKTRNNDRFMSLTCSDLSGVFNIILFGKSYEKFSSKVEESGIFIMKVATKFDNSEVKFFVEDLQKFHKDVKLAPLNSKNKGASVKESNAIPKEFYLEIEIDYEKSLLHNIHHIITNTEIGETPVFLTIKDINNKRVQTFNLNKKVSYNQGLINNISSIAKINLKYLP